MNKLCSNNMYVRGYKDMVWLYRAGYDSLAKHIRNYTRTCGHHYPVACIHSVYLFTNNIFGGL